MSTLILRTDEGPDFEVDDSQKFATVEAYSGKTGKHTGHVSIYACGQNYLLYCVDKTKPEGKNRMGWIMNPTVARSQGRTMVEEAIRLAGSRPAVKEALRKAGLDGPAITINPSLVVVE